jgi:REP element-mobilizing transposase RayT
MSAPLRQLDFRFRSHGGSRPGAGRPPKGPRAGVPHLARPVHSWRHPLHVTLRIVAGLPTLRGSSSFRKIKGALAAARARFGMRLVHFSVQRDHLHLVVEASDRRALSRGIQGLTIRVARAVNRRWQRTGRVFADRYHTHALKTPREVRNALAYVLCNGRKHAGTAGVAAGFVDARSSAAWFDGWARPRELAFSAEQESGGRDPPVERPQTWLLGHGWKRHGLIDVDHFVF